MSTDSGRRLTEALSDRYRVERELGVGGMATVYLAHDLKHERDVAIKVLHPDLAAALGGERFLSEIKTTAKLQHPHILALLDSGEAGGLLFYVMPFVPGETLRARLDREHQLPIDDALRIAREIADALAYAHGLGIVHRDIKPENILLQGEHALVADFGIALAVQQAGGQRMTQTGLSLGTPQYMAPEQAMGEKQIDARADIYALGAVAYEMLTGDPPFTGSTVQAIVARVITEDPRPLTPQRKAVPPGVEYAVLRALEKLPADRWSSAHAFAEALDGHGDGPGAGTTGVAHPVRPGRSSRWSLRSPAPWVAALVVAVAAAVWGWTRRPASDDGGVVRFVAQLAPGAQLAFPLPGTGATVAISPDGRQIVYSATTGSGSQLYVQSIDQLRPRALPGTVGAVYPAFSPDGKWIAFLSNDQTIKRMPVDGGSSTAICPAGKLTGLTWASNQTLVLAYRALSQSQRLWRVSADGGKPEQFSTPDTGIGRQYQGAPQAADDGRLVLYSSSGGSLQYEHIGVVTMATGRTTVLRNLAGSVPLGIVRGQLVYVRSDGALMAAPFNTRTLQAGTPVQVGDSIAVTLDIAAAALSPRGDLLYMHSGGMNQVVSVDDHGTATMLIDQKETYSHPRYSPDGRRLAFDVRGGQGTDVWVYDLAARTRLRLTTEGVNDRPEWTPDGTRVLYSSNRAGAKYALWWKSANGGTPAESVYAAKYDIREGIVSPDGRSVVYREDTPDDNRDILEMTVGSAQPPAPLLHSRADELMARLSPDGRWLAYVSDESGEYEVYVRALSGNGGQVPVSSGGGMEPLWSRDGHSLFYRNDAKLVEASVQTSPALAVTGRRDLFDANYATDLFHPDYDVAPDGKHFAMLKSADDERQLIVVQNWIREVRQRTTRNP